MDTDNMKRLFGSSLAPGFAEGRAFIYKPDLSAKVPQYRIKHSQVDGELVRFEQAVRGSIDELEKLREHVLSELGEAESGIFEAHLALLSDPAFIEKVKHRVANDLINVDHAVDSQITDLEKLLQDVKSEYVRERSHDIRDVGQRVLKHLSLPRKAHDHPLKRLPPDTVIVTVELLPSDTLQMDRGHVVALVTEKGGPSSHAAILARALGIPSVTRVPGICGEVANNDHMLVNAKSGTVVISPTQSSLARFAGARQRYETALTEAIRGESQDCITKDGVSVELFGNVGRVEEAALVNEHYLNGIGLFRTEYLFLEALSPPSLKKQYQAYKAVVGELGDLPVVIRTLDLGGDKIPPFLRQEFELNRNMGRRGLRYSLFERNLFKTQLAALLRASKHGNVHIMFPMVIEAGDVRKALEFVHRAAKRENVDRIPSIGAMIETPSSVFEIDEILKLVDFVSIGSNDLTQFMLATDRNSVGLPNEYTVLHPAVMKAIAKVAKAANAAGKGISLCGEVAGEPTIACLLVGLGVKGLSMSPVRTARVRQFIRSTSLPDLQEIARRVLESTEVEQVQTLMRDLESKMECTG
jgi:phosphoenolpyruvate-protein phosphotransferase